MIKRYEHPKIKKIFSPEQRLSYFVDIERYASLYHGVEIPDINIDSLLCSMDECEKITKHETVAFLQALSYQLDDISNLHFGMTSSDVLDTCLSLQIKEASSVLEDEIKILLTSLKTFCLKNKNTLMVGRSHGKAGELISLGFSFLSYYKEWERNLDRLTHAREEVSYGMVSGPMGNFSNINREKEDFICSRLGIKPEPVSTQVIPRDRHSYLMCVLGIIGASLERLSTHIRNLSQSGIEEISESFSVSQTGSSAMPHKKNPILSENVTGLARLLKSYVSPSLDNVSLWFERDMSHSSVERVTIEDAFHLSCFAVKRMTFVIDRLSVHKESLDKNIEREGNHIYSHSVLCHLMKKGVDRHEAYRFIQKVTQGNKDLFKELETSYPEHKVGQVVLFNECVSNIDHIFRNVFGDSK